MIRHRWLTAILLIGVVFPSPQITTESAKNTYEQLGHLQIESIALPAQSPVYTWFFMETLAQETVVTRPSYSPMHAVWAGTCIAGAFTIETAGSILVQRGLSEVRQSPLGTIAKIQAGDTFLLMEAAAAHTLVSIGTVPAVSVGLWITDAVPPADEQVNAYRDPPGVTAQLFDAVSPREWENADLGSSTLEVVFSRLTILAGQHRVETPVPNAITMRYVMNGQLTMTISLVEDRVEPVTIGRIWTWSVVPRPPIPHGAQVVFEAGEQELVILVADLIHWQAEKAAL